MNDKTKFFEILTNLKPYFLDEFWEKEPIINNSDAYQLWLWLRRVKLNYNKLTFSSYRASLFRFIIWLGGRSITLANVTEFHFDDYMLFLKNVPEELKGNCRGFAKDSWKPFTLRPLSAKSVLYNMQLVRKFIGDMAKSGYLVKNPFYFSIRKKDVIKNLPQHRYLELSEVVHLLDYIQNNYQESDLVRNVWLIKLLVYTGLRRSELVQAKMEDVIFMHGKWYLKIIGKGNKYAEIPMVPELIEALNIYRQHYGLKRVEKGDKLENIPLLIKSIKCTDEYQSYVGAHINYILRGICENFAKELQPGVLQDKILSLTPHWLRHTSATLQINMGVDPLIVQQNLRHEQLTTTMRYVHLSQQKQYDETAAKFRL